ncbi:MAG: hypothetical protein WD552_01585 [Candidatus Paceibacterota bacterium]
MEPVLSQEKLKKNFTSPEEEISYLREKISRSTSPESGVEHEDIDVPSLEREVVRSYSDDEDVLAPEYRMGEQRSDEIVLNLSPEPHDKQMDELLSILAKEGLKNTLQIVKKLDDPHLEDDFHRVLIQYVKEGYPLDGVKESSPRFKALHRRLFEVLLMSEDDEDKENDIRKLISATEQFYSGIMSLSTEEKPGDFTVSIEVATEHVGEQVSFYLSIPDVRADMFEKQLLSLFPRASVTEIADDYNIFNHDGISLGSRAQPSDKAILPLKTYDEFDHDPLNVLLNAFSKIKREGEGAAVQIVLQPAGDTFYKKYTNAIEKIEGGTSLSEAINVSPSFAKDVWKTAKDMFGREKKNDEDELKGPSQREQDAIERIQKKTASPIQQANIRLAASAASRTRAEKLLFDLESAFSQFAEPHGNSLSFKRVKEKEEREFFHQLVFRTFDKNLLIPLNVEELTTIMHFPVRDIDESRELKQSKSAQAPAPLEVPEEGILLGVNHYRGSETEVRIAAEDRMRHFYTIGQTGTGKTTLLQNMITQDIRAGRGCCFIDPHGDVTDELLSVIPPERFGDLIYFDPAHTARPMGLNMLEYNTDYPEQKTFVVNEMLSIFSKLFDMQATGGPMFEQYFRNATMLVLEDPESGSTLLEISRVLVDKSFREHKLSRSKNPIVNQFWREIASKAGDQASLENIVPYITSKFDNFLSNEIMRPIIAQQESSFNFRQIMDEEKILLVNLSKGRLGDINANLLGLILVGKILMAALSRVDLPAAERKPFYLYMDEFQNVSTDSIATILSEARKYQLSLNVAHQYIDQLQDNIRDAVFGNVGSMAAYRVSSKDAEALADMYEPVFSARDLMNVDNFNYFAKILASGQPVRPFSVSALPPQEGNAKQVEKLKELSYAKYGRDRAAVEAELAKKYENL